MSVEPGLFYYTLTTVTPSPTPSITITPSPSTTNVPSPSSTEATPTPTQTASATSPTPVITPTIQTSKLTATGLSGEAVLVPITGTIAASQVSDVTISNDAAAGTVTLALKVTGQEGTEGFGNLTIPKNAVSSNESPVIYIDGQKAGKQECTQDADNFYVWFSTHFSTHEVSIVFDQQPARVQSEPEFPWTPVIAIALAIVVVVGAVAVVKSQKKSSAKKK